MATSRPLLDRLLHTPDLAKVVPVLQPDVLHRVIQICGLEDAAEVVALATPAQLTRILDVDIWRVRAPGADEEFDVDRFGVWLDVLLQCGAAVAAEKLIGLDIDVITTGFSRHAVVFDAAAVAPYTTLDGEQVPGRVSKRPFTAEIGGYVLEARRTHAWETIVDLLEFLHAEHSEYFRRLMRGCVRLSSGPREADGFHHLLDDAEQGMFDLASDRTARREQQGFVTPGQARAFMEAARHVQLEGDRPAPSPIARAYFREIETAPAVEGDGVQAQATTPPDIEPAAIAGVFEVLRDAGVLAEEPRALLPPAEQDQTRLASIREFCASHPESAGELAYLANVIIAGCSIQSRPLTRQEASDAAVAIGNLGLENWPPHWNECDLITAFQAGWKVLHRDVSMFVARRLIDVIAEIACPDRDIQMRLRGLQRELKKCVRDGTPWRARNALDVLVMLDTPSWAAVLAATDECPVMHRAMEAGQDHARAINPTDFQFISENSQIGRVREFMASLGTRLMG